MTNNPNELTIENSALVLIDHQPAVGLAVLSIDQGVLVNNSAGRGRARNHERNIGMIPKIARRHSFLAAALLAIVGSACGDSPTSPSGTAVVTFGVGSETFRVQLVGDRQIEAARAAQAGGTARIPNGRIVAGQGVNTGWSWHLEDVEFAEVAIELCDGRPSDVERQGSQFGGGRFCPWNARVLAIQD